MIKYASPSLLASQIAGGRQGCSSHCSRGPEEHNGCVWVMQGCLGIVQPHYITEHMLWCQCPWYNGGLDLTGSVRRCMTLPRWYYRATENAWGSSWHWGSSKESFYGPSLWTEYHMKALQEEVGRMCTITKDAGRPTGHMWKIYQM